ncbi:MAG: hypothetical protein QNJ34_17195 [Xenococcaceae cyanobacterium MO_188.B29]|nr:hypothetical protein [Xenococcaceae cyanobacterium MO_188.B29]
MPQLKCGLNLRSNVTTSAFPCVLRRRGIARQYLDVEQGRELYGIYNQVLSGLVNMINNPNRWVIGK